MEKTGSRAGVLIDVAPIEQMKGSLHMTGSQTDPVKVPRHETAVTLLLRIASPLFQAAMRERDGAAYLDEGTYGHYCSLRDAAQYLLKARDTSLPSLLHVNMLRGLNAAHNLQHQLQPSPQLSITECECATASAIHALKDKLLRIAEPEAVTA